MKSVMDDPRNKNRSWKEILEDPFPETKGEKIRRIRKQKIKKLRI